MHLLIPAAGMGRRMGSEFATRRLRQRNKLFLTLLGKPLIVWTLEAAEAAANIAWMGMMVHPEDKADMQALVSELALTKPVEIIIGGATRQESVYNGLQALPEGAQSVLIHDGARCLATPQLLNRCAEALSEWQGLIAAVPVKDTIKVIDNSDLVQSTPPREQLMAAQTPQGFNAPMLKHCHDLAKKNNWQVTDDAALFERCNLDVRVLLGEETNLKVTTPQDLAIAEFILRQRLGL